MELISIIGLLSFMAIAQSGPYGARSRGNVFYTQNGPQGHERQKKFSP